MIRISYNFVFLHLKSDIGLCITHVSLKAEKHFQIINRFQGSVEHNQAKILFLNAFHFIPVSVVLPL